MTLYQNCQVKLWIFLSRVYKYIWCFYKMPIHLTKEFCLLHHKKWFNNVECSRDWLLQMQICVLKCVLVKLFLFTIFFLSFAYGVVFLMMAFLKKYPIRKIRNIPIYRIAYSIAMYRDTYRIARFLPTHSPSQCWVINRAVTITALPLHRGNEMPPRCWGHHRHHRTVFRGIRPNFLQRE